MTLLILLSPIVLTSSARGEARTDMVADAGILGLTVTNLGYVGNGFSNPFQPSGEYPIGSSVEHLFLGGLWVGAVSQDGTIHVSVGAQDVSNMSAGDEVREFVSDFLYWDPEDPSRKVVVNEWSNLQNYDNYHPSALASEHIEVAFNDIDLEETTTHTPLGLKVVMRALSWDADYNDDFVILDYSIINVSGEELSDVYVGYWNDTTVGNTQINNPYDSSQGQPWNYYDDKNGGWRPGDVDDDPGIWMMWERDGDGDDGMATSWIGTRLLGTDPEVAQAFDPDSGEELPPVSYNSWRFRDLPAQDDVYIPAGELEEQPGKYQLMANGHFDVDPPDTQEPNFSVESDWMGLLTTGPFEYFQPGDTLNVTLAVVCGADSLSLLENSKVAQLAYDDRFSLPSGPPSPRLEIGFANDTVHLSWTPGDSIGENEQGETVLLEATDPRRQPEHHISTVTAREDFQGYRIYRIFWNDVVDDPYESAVLLAEFDKIDGIGFDTGLPPLGPDGKRHFTDTGLLDGFMYTYAVTSYSAPDLDAGLGELESGIRQNATEVFPGPGSSPIGEGPDVGVFPNPYRAGSYFDDPFGDVELGRQIWFTNLPARCTIKIFNLAGDLVRTLEHDDPNHGMETWDILSESPRAIASGLYVFVVEDLSNGRVQRGKLVIIK